MTKAVNAVVCGNCLTYLESTHRHDYKVCKCWDDPKVGWVAVDGGQDYMRRGFSEGAAFIEVGTGEWYQSEEWDDVVGK